MRKEEEEEEAKTPRRHAGADSGLVAGKVTPFTSTRKFSTAWVLHSIGGSARLRSMATRFYARAFKDGVLDRFIEDHGDPHGERLGNWVAEKMGGEGAIWSNSRPAGARGTAHRRAWYSHKRDRSRRGRRFKVDDCRVWMRLMFWAARDEGLHEHQPFWDWFVPFIADWIRVYEHSAGRHARADAEWSADAGSVAAYEGAGRVMEDVVGGGTAPRAPTGEREGGFYW